MRSTGQPLSAPFLDSSHGYSNRDTYGGGEANQANTRESAFRLAEFQSHPPQDADDDALFQTNYEITWTVADQHRLYYIDRLQSRTLEYHNNIHNRGIYSSLSLALTNKVQANESVAFMMTAQLVDKAPNAEVDGSVGASIKLDVTKSIETVNGANFPTKLDQMRAALQKSGNAGPCDVVYWVHLLNVSTLLTVMERLGSSADAVSLVAATFSDLRFHSTFTPLVGGCLATICYFQMHHLSLNVSIFKLYFYMSRGVVITFVAELMPDEEAPVGPPVDISTASIDPSTTSVPDTSETSSQRSGRKASFSTNSAMDAATAAMNASSIDAVYGRVLARWSRIAERAVRVGPVSVFHELCAEALSTQDPLLEFFSRTTFHLRRRTSFRMPYRKRVQFMRRIHVVMSAIRLVEAHTARVHTLVEQLISLVESANGAMLRSAAAIATASVCNQQQLGGTHTCGADTVNSGGNALLLQQLSGTLVPPELLGHAQLPFLYDLANSFQFATDCLEGLADETRTITAAVDAISQLRANNTALVLSLIATIFLPATFLTGVFGMNFSVDGGFTIGLVNDPYGPYAFYGMCAAVVAVSFAYFLSMRWIEAFDFIRYFVKLLCGRSRANRLLRGNDDDDDEEELNRDAGIHSSNFRRSFNKASAGINREESSLANQSQQRGHQGSSSHSPLPKRVAEALEEDRRRNAEAKRRREFSQQLAMLTQTQRVSGSGGTNNIGGRQQQPTSSRRRNDDVDHHSNDNSSSTNPLVRSSFAIDSGGEETRN